MKSLLIAAALAMLAMPAPAAQLRSGPPDCGPDVCVLNSAGGSLGPWLAWYFENGGKRFVIPAGAACNSMCAGFAMWKVAHDAAKGRADWQFDGQLCWCHEGLRDEFVMSPLEQHGYAATVRAMLTGQPFKVRK